MIIGTAGHIDHGKTSLVARLTGKDTDRLPEEKRRGISIELGYAYLQDPLTSSGPVLGFVDVPGHEKFVHAMVSGASGIDFALLVIAADDGPMPQTIEHLDILRLLGIDRGAVVLTKIDKVDAAIGDQAVTLIGEALSGQPASHWPLFPVSSVTGDGIAALRTFLFEQARQHRTVRNQGCFRLAVDRSFSLPGIGTVVTGTAHAGVVRVGDEVAIAEPGCRDFVLARVRSIHAQDRVSESGCAGERLALNLAGVSVQQAPRGSWINGAEQGRMLSNMSLRMDVALTVSGSHERMISQGLEVHLHHGSHDQLARIYPLDCERAAPGSQCLASVVLTSPIAVCSGDRLVIRDSQAKNTLAGAVVLDTFSPTRGKRTPARLNLLALIAQLQGDSIEPIITAMAAQAPVPVARLMDGWNLQSAQMDAVLSAASLHRAADVVFDAGQWRALGEKIVLAVDEAHVREPEMLGLEVNRLRRIAAPALSVEVFTQLLESLIGQELLVRRGAFVARPQHKAELGSAERNLWESIRPLLEQSPYNPPRVRDIANQVNIPEAEIRANLRRVSRIGEVVLVALDHFFITQHVAEMAEMVRELCEIHGCARAADFRDRIGGGRKVAIQILEFFDRVGYTRRLRDEHILRGTNPFAQTQEQIAAV